MQNKFIYFILILGVSLACEREISPEQADRFIKFYGNYMMDEARDVELLDNGGYAICGIDSIPDWGKRMVLIVTDEFGNVKDGFPAYYTETGLESGANTLVAIRGGQGGFLLCGFVERELEESTGVQKDVLLVKVSSSGQELWKRSFGSLEDEVILHATERISSGFMLAGYSVKDGKSDILITGVREEGDSIPLSLNYNNPFAENATANFLLNTGDRYMCVCTYDKIGGLGTDILVLNFTDDLSPLDKNLTDDLDEFGLCILEDDTDRYLVLGNRINASGNQEIVVHMIETNGLLITKSVMMATIKEGGVDLIGKRFVKTSDGRYAIVGTLKSADAEEMFVQFLLSDYTIGGRVIFGSSGDQSGADIALTRDNGLVMLGTSEYRQNSMISLIKTSDTGDL